MAEALCRGFRAHDDGRREDAVEAFAVVDRHQFDHLSPAKSREAARAYTDALFRKNQVEFEQLSPEGLDPDKINTTDWAPVAAKFRERAAIVGMDPEYARQSTLAWKRHKGGGDYWTPIQRAQLYELRAAIDDPAYPRKPKHGQSGFGPEPARYALGIELHDMHTDHHWEQAMAVMTPYFKRILNEQERAG
ncbi:MAG: hypothetical protein ACI8TL_001882 [Natronomonas sp.]|jgi:hypothetical protein